MRKVMRTKTHGKGIEGLSDQQLIRKLTELESRHGKAMPARQEAKPTVPEKPNPEPGVQDKDKPTIVVDNEMKKAICEATGVQTKTLALILLGQVMIMQDQTLKWLSDGVGLQEKGMAAIGEMKPSNMSEAMLAIQLIGVHDAAVKFMAEATHPNQTFEGREAGVLRATRLMSLFIEQLEAMAKLKGKAGQQKVIVEHVHIHQGGQAIVGAVTAGKGDRGEGGQ